MIFKKGAVLSFFLKRLARAQGFLDPMVVLASLERFAKPSDVWVPTELLRAGAVLHARGLINSQAIQHNLDWVWPYWVKRQFDPKDEAFIPRAFSMTHINLTHRNWTALGLPGYPNYPIVDPRGLITPFYDGWSLDFWVVHEDGLSLIPSEQKAVKQQLLLHGNLKVATTSSANNASLETIAEVVHVQDSIHCRVSVKGLSRTKGWLAVSVRPYNPEGISFINHVRLLDNKQGWRLDDKHEIHLSESPARYVFSNYHDGDVSTHLLRFQNQNEARCPVGMATTAALYPLEANQEKEIFIDIPLEKKDKEKVYSWTEAIEPVCRLEIPDKNFQFIYDAALHSLILFSPDDVFPGPYTYKRFWFRDAAFIIHAMASVGLTRNLENIINRFPRRQTPLGYFLSQEGEWDANGEALWAIDRYLKLMNMPLKDEWQQPVIRAAKWIQRKRNYKSKEPNCEGLLPAGFSAEHFGPSDYYYWDDFWSVSGLRSAARMVKSFNSSLAMEFSNEANDLLNSVETSLKKAQARLGHNAMPPAPNRRMDSGAIGNLVASYPLQIFAPDDQRVQGTIEYMLKHCFQGGGFYHEISHSGINAYLTMSVAQALLRIGDDRFFKIAQDVADLATSTGQWPEAIHPQTKGGCMGDGQHAWAAAEWVMLMHNMFVREEEWNKTLILGSGIPAEWLQAKRLFFGPVRTTFGVISITIECEKNVRISWDAEWFNEAPRIEIQLPGFKKTVAAVNETAVEFERKHKFWSFA